MVPVNFFALTLKLFNAIICYASMSVIDFCPLDCDSYLSSMKHTISQVTSVAIAGDLSIRAVAAPRTNPFAGSVDPLFRHRIRSSHTLSHGLSTLQVFIMVADISFHCVLCGYFVPLTWCMATTWQHSRTRGYAHTYCGLCFRSDFFYVVLIWILLLHFAKNNQQRDHARLKEAGVKGAALCCILCCSLCYIEVGGPLLDVSSTVSQIFVVRRWIYCQCHFLLLHGALCTRRLFTPATAFRRTYTVG